MGVGVGMQDKDDQKGSMVGRNIVVVSEEGGTRSDFYFINDVREDDE